MIRLEKLTKVFWVEGHRKVVFDGLDCTIPTGVSVGLLGRNGAGKSTLLQIIAGTMEPTSGRVWSDGTISYPVGFSGSFHPDLSGAQNTRFVARIYGVDTEELIAFVEDFAELGPSFHMPFRTYSAGMRARLAFGVSMGIGFDTYLVDEVTAVGDAIFRRKSEQLFLERMSRSGAILVNHNIDAIRRLCTAGIVLDNGTATWHDNVEDAIAHHNWNLRAA